MAENSLYKNTLFLRETAREPGICSRKTPKQIKAALVAQLDAHPTGDQEVVGLTPMGRQHSFVEIDHEIFSMVILSLPLISEGQLSVSGKRLHNTG